jgi:8-oxo-dGTP diphosphatase
VIEVAAAVLQRADGAFLLARRPQGKVYAGWWEFPGGKIEPGEPAHAALARELREELGIEARRAYPWITRVHQYPHGTVRLNFFRVTDWVGEPRAVEHDGMRWQGLGGALPEPMLPANAPVLASLALPHEYAITQAEALGVEPMLRRLEERFAAGLRLVQVRDRGLAPEARAALARGAVEAARRHGARVLVAADAELARACGADGVHFSARELLALRERPAPGLCAASCHDASELACAMQLGLDFALLGPVRPTPTHAGAAVLGWERFAALARGASIPVFAIGGLRPADLEQAWRAGAHGLAMISGSWR